MRKNLPLLVAGFLFSIVAILHLLRYLFKIQINAGGYNVPMELSIYGFVVTLLLAFWMFWASHNPSFRNRNNLLHL